MIRTLTCRQVIAVLMDYVDGTLAASTRRGVEHHLKTCAPCRDFERATARRLAWCGGRPACDRRRHRACGSCARGRSSGCRVDRDRWCRTVAFSLDVAGL